MRDKFRVAFRAFLAAITSPEAVKLERGLAAFVAVRIAIALGASVGFVELVDKIIGG